MVPAGLRLSVQADQHLATFAVSADGSFELAHPLTRLCPMARGEISLTSGHGRNPFSTHARLADLAIVTSKHPPKAHKLKALRLRLDKVLSRIEKEIG